MLEEHSTVAPSWRVLTAGLDRLELWAWRPSESSPVPRLEPGRTWRLDPIGLELHPCATGTRNHLHRWRDDVAGVELAVDSRKREGGGGCRESCGDVNIRLHAEWCHSHRVGGALLCDGVRGGVAALLGLLGCVPELTRVARVDPHVDFCGPELAPITCEQVTGRAAVTCDESTAWSSAEVDADAHKGDEWHAWRVKRPGRGSQWSGFRCGCKGGTLLRVYDKQLERRTAGLGLWGKYVARYPEAGEHAATWRVEWELRGQVLTEHGLREWPLLHVRLPEVLRHRAKRTRALANPVAGRAHIERAELHPLWKAVVEVLGPGPERAPRRRRSELEVAAQHSAETYGRMLTQVLALQQVCEREHRPGPLDLVARPTDYDVTQKVKKLRRRYTIAPRLSDAALDELVGPGTGPRGEQP